MKRALIGFSGFVGSTLLKQTSFDSCYRSSNIDEISGQSFDMVICAAAPAQKWIANREPEVDQKKIDGLISRLEKINCKTFVLISTIDVFKNPMDVDEETMVVESGLHAYGFNRYTLEKFVKAQFVKHVIVRLPGLVGPGLRKNIIFDLLNKNNLEVIDSRGTFQFYPMVNLWYDICTALQLGVDLVHLTAEPITISEIAEAGFGRTFNQMLENPIPVYNMRSKYAPRFGGVGEYQYSKRETIGAVRAYAQSEPLTIIKKGEAS